MVFWSDVFTRLSYSQHGRCTTSIASILSSLLSSHTLSDPIWLFDTTTFFSLPPHLNTHKHSLSSTTHYLILSPSSSISYHLHFFFFFQVLLGRWSVIPSTCSKREWWLPKVRTRYHTYPHIFNEHVNTRTSMCSNISFNTCTSMLAYQCFNM